MISYSISLTRFLSIFGASIAISIGLDCISIMTLHIFCFHVYVARLYQLEMRCLYSFLHFFRGKKYNPLRNRIDSANFDAQQLFLGTIVFTILIFLLPTILAYYCVFTFLWLARHSVLSVNRLLIYNSEQSKNDGSIIDFLMLCMYNIAKGSLTLY